MQNCTTVQCFMLHAVHGWKPYHVIFPTQQTSCNLDFPIKSYDRVSGHYTEGQQPGEAPRVSSSWWHLSYYNSRNSKVHSHPTRRVVTCINTICISEIKQDFDNEIEPLLFSYVLTNSERDLYPFALVDPLGLQKRPLHRHLIRAPSTLCAGCIGCFFESVIGRILGLGCHIETVVGSLCVSSGCTSYPAACS